MLTFRDQPEKSRYFTLTLVYRRTIPQIRPIKVHNLRVNVWQEEVKTKETDGLEQKFIDGTNTHTHTHWFLGVL